MDVYKRMEELGLTLDAPLTPMGLYRPCVEFLDGKLVYTSGAGCRKGERSVYTGKVGAEVSLEEGKECARQCALNLLAGLHKEIGDLNRIKRIVKVLGFVASAPDFYQHPKVINGASELLADIFGEDGVGARSAIGVCALPANIPVEVEMLVELRDPE